MPVTIELFPNKATIKDYQWTSDNRTFQAMLNEMLNIGGPSGDDPDPDFTAAKRIAKVLGADIIKHEQVEDDAPPGAVF